MKLSNMILTSQESIIFAKEIPVININQYIHIIDNTDSLNKTHNLLHYQNALMFICKITQFQIKLEMNFLKAFSFLFLYLSKKI